MPFIKVSKEALKTLKDYLSDIEGVTAGELAEGCIAFALVEKIAEFEDYVGLEELDYDEKDTDEEEDTDEEGGQRRRKQGRRILA